MLKNFLQKRKEKLNIDKLLLVIVILICFLSICFFSINPDLVMIFNCGLVMSLTIYVFICWRQLRRDSQKMAEKRQNQIEQLKKQLSNFREVEYVPTHESRELKKVLRIIENYQIIHYARYDSINNVFVVVLIDKAGNTVYTEQIEDFVYFKKNYKVIE